MARPSPVTLLHFALRPSPLAEVSSWPRRLGDSPRPCPHVLMVRLPALGSRVPSSPAHPPVQLPSPTAPPPRIAALKPSPPQARRPVAACCFPSQQFSRLQPCLLQLASLLGALPVLPPPTQEVLL